MNITRRNQLSQEIFKKEFSELSEEEKDIIYLEVSIEKFSINNQDERRREFQAFQNRAGIFFN